MFQNIIPERARIILYGVYGYAGWILAAIVAGFYAAGQNPRWLIISGAVYMFLGKPFSQLAGDNVTIPTLPVVAPAAPATTTASTVPAVVPATTSVTPPTTVPAGYVQTESGLVPAPATVPNAGE